MKIKNIFFVACLLIISIASKSQNNNVTYTTKQFKVYGACGMCKDRIEAAAKIRGVKTALWDVATNMMKLEYDSLRVSLLKVQEKIVAVGHDVENLKANDKVYGALPGCCHYREIEAIPHKPDAEE